MTSKLAPEKDYSKTIQAWNQLGYQFVRLFSIIPDKTNHFYIARLQMHKPPTEQKTAYLLDTYKL